MSQMWGALHNQLLRAMCARVRPQSSYNDNYEIYLTAAYISKIVLAPKVSLY